MESETFKQPTFNISFMVIISTITLMEYVLWKYI